jgi:hypothetical protein
MTHLIAGMVCKEFTKRTTRAKKPSRSTAKVAVPLIWRDLIKPHGLTANHIASATAATTTVHHTTGVTCFELPLRGESLAAWLNS